jgi:hypothetical protein
MCRCYSSPWLEMIQLRKENLKRLPTSIGCQPRLHLNANSEDGQCASVQENGII